MEAHASELEGIIKGELLLFRTLWATTNDNMFVVCKALNGDYISELTNPAMKKTLGLASAQIDNIPLTAILDPVSYRLVHERYESCIRSGQAASYEESHLINGRVSYWDTTIIPVIDDQYAVTRIFGVSRNVTELKQLTESLEDTVQERTAELEIALAEIERISNLDKLTGLYNRYKLDSLLERVQAEVADGGNDYAIVMIDIDLFKGVNDRFGHIIGDQVLIEFSQLVQCSIRENDILGRWGGEEFLLIMPHSSVHLTLLQLNAIRQKVEAYGFSSVGNLTASFGAAVFNRNESVDSVLSRADAALYWVKNNGRNNSALKHYGLHT